MKASLRIAGAFVAARTIERLVAKATGVGKVAQIARAERSMYDLLRNQWELLIPIAAAVAVRAIQQGRSPAQVEESVARIMSTWPDSVMPAYLASLEDVYYLAREAGWQKAATRTGSLSYDGVTKATDDVPSIGIGDIVDRKAIEALQNKEKFWMGDLWRAGWSTEIRRVAEDAISSGRGTAPSGEQLGRSVTQALTNFKIPGGYNGPAETYFEGVAANAVTVARSQGQLRSFVDLGVVRFTIVNPEDDRTCPVCSMLNGKVFETSMGTDQMSREIAAKDPDRVKEVHPWLTAEKLSAMTSGPGNTNQREEALAKAGVVLPPYHFRCRCTIDASIEAGSWTPPATIEEKPTKPVEPTGPQKPTIPQRPTKPPEPARKPKKPSIVVDTPSGPVSAKPRAPMPGLTETTWNANDRVAPRESFDIKLMEKNLKDLLDNQSSIRAQAAVRKDLNTLSVRSGVQPADLVLKKEDRAKIDVAKVETDWAGVHYTSTGKTGVTEKTLKNALEYLEKVNAGEFVDIYGDGKYLVGGMKTLVHEQLHASVMTNGIHGEMALGGVGGKAVRSHAGKMYIALEETGTETASWIVMKREFGINPYKQRFHIGSYIEEINSIENKVLKPALARAGISDVSVEEMDRIMGEAGLALRSRTDRIRGPQQYINAFAEGLQLPWTASELSNAEKEKALETVKKEFKKLLDKNAELVWKRD